MPSTTSNQHKVLVIIGDASETLDTLYPIYRLQESRFTPVVAGPKQKTYQLVMHEVKPGWTITKEWKATRSMPTPRLRTSTLSNTWASSSVAAGRLNTFATIKTWFVTRHFFDANKPICSVCHGVEIPAYADCDARGENGDGAEVPV